MAARAPILLVATPGAALLLLLSACTSDTVCGAGTIEVDGTCVVDDTTAGSTTDGGSGSLPPADSDAGMEDPMGSGSTGGTGGGGSGSGSGTGGTGSGGGSGSGSADGGYSTDPPGSDSGGSAATGCDAASGECDAWEEAIAAGLVERQMAAGCDHAMMSDPRIDGVAETHAAYQASIDMLTSDSPDGSLFDQVSAAGVDYRDVASLFSVSVDGPDDVLTRWDASTRAAPILTRCDTIIGVGVATGASGDSYVTVLMARL